MTQTKNIMPQLQSFERGAAVFFKSLPINGYGLLVYRGWQAPGASQL